MYGFYPAFLPSTLQYISPRRVPYPQDFATSGRLDYRARQSRHLCLQMLLLGPHQKRGSNGSTRTAFHVESTGALGLTGLYALHMSRPKASGSVFRKMMMSGIGVGESPYFVSPFPLYGTILCISIYFNILIACMQGFWRAVW